MHFDPKFPILEAEEDVHPGIVSPECTSTSGFFANSHHFTIKGGQFAIHNHINSVQGAPRGRPKAFREIDWCDIILQDNLDVVRARVMAPERCSVLRNAYSAKIEGQHNPDKTVVIYEGDGAKHTWYDDISKYLRVRHPRVFQLFGLSYSGGMYAAIFHRQEHALESYSPEPITKIYFYSFLYHAPALARMLQLEILVTSYDCSLWLNPSGQLYFELGTHMQDLILPIYSTNSQVQRPLLVASTDLIPVHQLLKINESLTLKAFQHSCFTAAKHWFHLPLEIWPSAMGVRPGSVMALCLPGHERLTAHEIRHRLSNLDREDIREVAFLDPTEVIHISPVYGTLMDGGWNCIQLGSIESSSDRLHLEHRIPGKIDRRSQETIPHQLTRYFSASYSAFPCQTSYIFSRQKYCSLSDFNCIINDVRITFSPEPPPHQTILPDPAFLFLPPTKDCISSDGMRLQYPDRAPYWSLHPSGNPRLSPEQAAILCLPPVNIEISMFVHFYSAQFYAAAAEFYRRKGFDPTSQDVARELGEPLYHLVDDDTDPVKGSLRSYSNSTSVNEIQLDKTSQLTCFPRIRWSIASRVRRTTRLRMG
ncbi:hypothetical protein R3P38DRAFT_2760029 [Favolaschia claudopus]|uniref:Uncharacterized protein n=1 Tax=Favolaschia claudopus TaxID=2862362 RepID=A0AAW0E122_9AGAR